MSIERELGRVGNKSEKTFLPHGIVPHVIVLHRAAVKTHSLRKMQIAKPFQSGARLMPTCGTLVGKSSWVAENETKQSPYK